MKKTSLLMGIFLSIFFSANIYSQNYAAQAAWGYGAKATGGTGGKVVTVTTMSALISEASKSTEKKIILVKGNLTCTSMQTIQDAKNLTIIGLPGATLSNDQRTSGASGILYVKRTSNLIIRNLTFKSAGAYDCDGNDNLCFDGVTDAWVDHCDFQDGVDGNFDNKGNTDNVTISWCRFRYLIAPKAGGSGGSDDHRFTNLLGSSASDKPADGRYNITWAYCWWDSGCKERMVRGRNADLHFLNCYWNSSVANYYIGPENLGAYIEGSTFEGAANSSSKIWKSYGGTNPVKFVSCAGSVPANSGSPVTPSYSYSALTAAASKTAVISACGAGATLQVNTTTGAVSSSCNETKPTITLTSGEATAAQTVMQGAAIQEINYVYGGTATGFSVAYSGIATSKPAWLTFSNGKFTGTPTGYTQNGTLTIKIKAITSGSATSEELTATINITVPAPATLSLTSGNTNQTAYIGSAISNIVYTYGGGATGVNITGLPTGVTGTVNANKTITISGAPTATGTFNYTVTTVGGQTNLSQTGKITVSTPTTLGAPIASYTVTGSTANVSWVAVTGASSYNVKWCSSTGVSGTTNKDWDFNAAAYTSGSISTLTIDGATFTSGGSSYSFATGKAKTYTDGFAGGGKALATGGNSTYSNGLPSKRFASFAVDGPVKVTAWFFGNSTGDRGIIFSAGTEATEEIFISTDQAPIIATYNYTGGAGTIYVYSDASINISRIKVEPAAATSCQEKSVAGLTTTINPFDNTTGTIFVQAVSNTAAYVTGEYAKATAQNIAVNATLARTSGAATTTQSLITGNNLTAITYSYTGTPSINWTGTTNATTAPAGINVNMANGTIAITGTPTVVGSYGYTVKAMPINGGTPTAGLSLSGTITVAPAPVNASLALTAESSASAVVNVGELVDIDYDYTGATPVIIWSGSSTTKPAGVDVEIGSNYLTIYGVPTVVGNYNYTINVAGLNGGTAAAAKSGTITVNAALIVPTNVTATSTSNSVTVNWDANSEATSFKVKLCKQVEGAIADEWDFSSWTINASNADANLLVDEGNDQRFNYTPVASTPQPVTFANGTVIPDLAGLKFQQTGGSKLRLGFGTGQIYLNGTGIKVEIPTQAGDIVTIVGPAGSISTTPDTRGYSVTNGTLQISECINVVQSGANAIMNVTGAVGTWVYTATGTSLTVTTVVGGMNINKIMVASAGTAPVCEPEQVVANNSVTFAGLDNNTEYTYSVQAIRGVETTAYSTEKTISTKADDSPQAASITLTSDASTEAQTVVAGTAIMPIAYSYTGSGVVIGWTPSTPAGISGTTEISGTPSMPGSYTYTITVNGINGGAQAQASGAITVLAPLTVPSNIVPNPAQTSIDLSWNSVPGAEKYVVNLCHNEETEGTGGESGEVLSYNNWDVIVGSIVNDATNGISITAVETQGSAPTYIELNNNVDIITIESSKADIANIEFRYAKNNATNTTYPVTTYLSSSDAILGMGTFASTNNTYVINNDDCPAGTRKITVVRDPGNTLRVSDIKVTLVGSDGGTIIVPVCNTYETNTNSITISNLTPETEYSYQVKAIRGIEETAYSSAAKTITTASKVDPVAPINVTATYGQTLADATLPTGWTWVLGGATSVGNAGNNNFKANFAGDDNYNAKSNVDVMIVVSKLGVAKPSLITSSFTYDGAAKTVSLNATGSYALSGQTQTNAGSYQATVTLNDKINTQWVDGLTTDLKLDWNIVAAQITKPALTASSFTYDGTIKTVTLTASSAAYVASGTQSASNAGNYTVTVTLVSTANYQWTDATATALSLSWTINKAAAPSAPTGLAATYGQTLVDVTLPSGWTWVNSSASVGNAGSQVHKANYAGDTNTNNASNVDVAITVNKASAPAAPAGLSATYGQVLSDITLPTGWTWVNPSVLVGNAGIQTHQANYAGDANTNNASNVDVAITVNEADSKPAPTGLIATYGQTLSDVTLPNGWTWVNSNSLVGDAGSQIHKADFAGDVNYTAKSNVDVVVAVSKASIVKPALTASVFTYDATTKTVTLNTSNAAYAVGGTQSASNAGNYTVTVTLLSTANYQWADATTTALSLSWTINKAAAPSAPTGLAATYGQTLVDVTLPSGWTWVNSTSSVGNAGSQTHQANYAGDGNVNNASNVDVNVLVNKATITQPALVENTFVYNATLKSVALTVENAGYTLKGRISATDAGNYLAAVELNDKVNTQWTGGGTTELPLSWSITKAPAPVTAPTDLTAIIGQTLNEIALPEGWTWVDSSASVGEVGEQTHQANYDGGNNYESLNNVDIIIMVNIQTTIAEAETNKLQITHTATELKTMGIKVMQICLYGVSGQYFGCANAATMDISSLIKGTSYIAQIRTESGKLVPYKFIK